MKRRPPGSTRTDTHFPYTTRVRLHREALWEAVRLGIADVVGSDHAPHTREEKAAPYPRSPSGMPGVQTLLPLLLDHLNAGKLTLERLVRLVSLRRRSEEHTSELQPLMRISYAVFCLTQKIIF